MSSDREPLLKRGAKVAFGPPQKNEQRQRGSNLGRHQSTKYPATFPEVPTTVFGTAEAAAITGIPDYRIRKWCEKGLLPTQNLSEKDRSRHRFKGVDLFALLMQSPGIGYAHTIKRLVRTLRLGEVPPEVVLAYALGDI